jgi:hypothetical protein
MRRFAVALGILVASATACPAEFIAQAENFGCLQSGTQPEGKHFFVFHKNKRKLRKAVRVAARDLPGKRYPVGTILQFIAGEAMVKRGGRFNREGNGWEFFRLAISPAGTTIVARGGAEVTNTVFPGRPAASCQNCHAPAKQFDFICEGHAGVQQLGLPDNIIRLLQVDPRCPPTPERLSVRDCPRRSRSSPPHPPSPAVPGTRRSS